MSRVVVHNFSGVLRRIHLPFDSSRPLGREHEKGERERERERNLIRVGAIEKEEAGGE